MKSLVIFVLISSLASTLGIGIVLGECIKIYTQSYWCHMAFQSGFCFLSSLFVSNYVLQNYFIGFWGVKR